MNYCLDSTVKIKSLTSIWRFLKISDRICGLFVDSEVQIFHYPFLVLGIFSRVNFWASSDNSFFCVGHRCQIIIDHSIQKAWNMMIINGKQNTINQCYFHFFILKIKLRRMSQAEEQSDGEPKSKYYVKSHLSTLQHVQNEGSLLRNTCFIVILHQKDVLQGCWWRIHELGWVTTKNIWDSISFEWRRSQPQ